jgi:hypothetical protein
MPADPPEAAAEAPLPFAMWVPVGRAVLVPGMTAVAGAAAVAGAVTVAGPGGPATCSLTPLPLSVAHADRAIMLRTTPEKSILREKRLNILKTYLDQLISGFVRLRGAKRDLTAGARLVARCAHRKADKQIIIHRQPSRVPRDAIEGKASSHGSSVTVVVWRISSDYRNQKFG